MKIKRIVDDSDSLGRHSSPKFYGEVMSGYCKNMMEDDVASEESKNVFHQPPELTSVLVDDFGNTQSDNRPGLFNMVEIQNEMRSQISPD